MGEKGFEPPTPWFVATCSNPPSYKPHLVSTGSVPLEKKNKGTFPLPRHFGLRRCESVFLPITIYKKGVFRGVKWERRDVIIGVLNKTKFLFVFYFFLFFIFKK